MSGALPLSCHDDGKTGGVPPFLTPENAARLELSTARKAAERARAVAILRAALEATWAKDYPIELSTLPGAGKKGARCGDWGAVGICRQHIPFSLAARQMSCGRRECPTCAGRCPGGESCGAELGPHQGGEWAHGEAREAARRLTRWLATLPSNAQIRQVIVSAPVGWAGRFEDHRATIGRVRRQAIRACKELAWGSVLPWGTVVVHLYRGCEAEGYNRWGPHAHVLCGGIDARKTAAYKHRTGWVVKQATHKRSGKFVGYRGDTLYRHLVYELGHSSIVEGGHALVSWGGLHTFHSEPEEEDPPARKCEECGEDLEGWNWRWYWDGVSERANIDGVWTPVTLHRVGEKGT